MKLSVTLGTNTFTFEDASLTPEAVSLYRSWLNAQSLEPAVTIEELTATLRTSTDQLQTAVSSLSGTGGQ